MHLKKIVSGKVKYSVVVPVYNQWEYISDLLDCIRAQSLGRHEFELLLVDNGSDLVLSPAVLDANVQLLHCSIPGSYSARNVGISASRGDWLVFTDADCLPDKDWLLNLDREIASYDDKEDKLFAGSIELTPSGSSPNIYEIYDAVKGIPQERYVEEGYAATANFACSRELATSLHGFDARMFSGGDREFCARAMRGGAALKYLPEMRVRHRARTTAREVFTKVRRLKGGQFSRCAGMARGWVVLRTFFPPVFAAKDFLMSRGHSYDFRIKALSVLGLVWFVEVVEVFRLSFFGAPERR